MDAAVRQEEADLEPAHEQDVIGRFADERLEGFLRKPFGLDDLTTKLRDVLAV